MTDPEVTISLRDDNGRLEVELLYTPCMTPDPQFHTKTQVLALLASDFIMDEARKRGWLQPTIPPTQGAPTCESPTS